MPGAHGVEVGAGAGILLEASRRGLRALLLIGGLLAARFINWTAQRITRRIDAEYQESDQLVRSESAKHRQAVASVISYVSVGLLFVLVLVQITDILAIPIGSLVAPAAVIGAALGFGAQRLVQDLLSGFFIITEKQYGFGDLVALTVAGIARIRASQSSMSPVSTGIISTNSRNVFAPKTIRRAPANCSARRRRNSGPCLPQ